MTKIDVVTIPESREDSDTTEKYLTILDKQNQIVAKRFKTEPRDVTLQFYDNKSALVGSLGPNQNGYGIYSGYVDGTEEIKILHPASAEGLLDDIEKELTILIVNCLTKMYLCKKYYPEDKDFKLYHRYLSDIVARISAGNFHEKSIRFDMKLHFDGIKYKKEQELGISFYLMLKNSGLDYIYEHLDLIMSDLKIGKTIETIYNKPLGELIKPVKAEILEDERVAQELEKQKRAAQREAMINERKQRELKFAEQRQRQGTSNSPESRRVHISSGKYSNNNNKNYNSNNKPKTTTNNSTKPKATNNNANSNNPNNKNYNPDNKTKSANTNANTSTTNKNTSTTKSKSTNEVSNKPQKFATPKVNFSK